jgi:hypothetical protein
VCRSATVSEFHKLLSPTSKHLLDQLEFPLLIVSCFLLELTDPSFRMINSTLQC